MLDRSAKFISKMDFDISRCKAQIGDKIAMMGCIGTQHVLIEVTPDLVPANTKVCRRRA